MKAVMMMMMMLLMIKKRISSLRVSDGVFMLLGIC